jgi:aryl-alcohol dehydrogenase-like predicted oxidoreductase
LYVTGGPQPHVIKPAGSPRVRRRTRSSIFTEVQPTTNDDTATALLESRFPLACGLLTGKYRPGSPPTDNSRFAAGTKVADALAAHYLTDQRFSQVERLEAFAVERGHTLVELAFSWLASQAVVGSIIAGATNPQQVKVNAAAAAWSLSSEDLEQVGEIVADEQRAGAQGAH